MRGIVDPNRACVLADIDPLQILICQEQYIRRRRRNFQPERPVWSIVLLLLPVFVVLLHGCSELDSVRNCFFALACGLSLFYDWPAVKKKNCVCAVTTQYSNSPDCKFNAFIFTFDVMYNTREATVL